MTNTADILNYMEQQLRDLPDADLDAVVATTVFGQPDAKPRPFSSSWEGLGRIIEHLRQRGYTLHFYVFEPSHLDWMNNLPSTLSRGEPYLAAEVNVVDIPKRLRLGPRELNLRARADTLPRAAALAAVLTCQREKAMAQQLSTDAPESSWSEVRRRQQSERMKEYWQRRRSASGAN